MRLWQKILIAVLVVILLAGLGGGAYWYFCLRDVEEEPPIVLSSEEELAVNYLTAMQLRDFETVQQMTGIAGGEIPQADIDNWFAGLDIDWLDNVDLDVALEEYKTHVKKPVTPLELSTTSHGSGSRVMFSFDITFGEGKEATVEHYKFIVTLVDGVVQPELGFTTWPKVYTPVKGVKRYGLLLDSVANGEGYGYVITSDVWYDVPVKYTFHDQDTEQAVEPIPALMWKQENGDVHLSLECNDDQNVMLRSAIHAQMNLALEYLHLDRNVITDPIDPVDIEAELKAYKRLSKKDKEAYDIQKAEEAEQAKLQAEENLANREARMETIEASEIKWSHDLWSSIKSSADSTTDQIQQYKINIVPNAEGEFPESLQLDYDIFKIKTAVTAVLKGASSGTDEAHIICYFIVERQGEDYTIRGLEFNEGSNPFAKVTRFVKDW